MDTTVWVVLGSSGEYSQWTQQAVAAYPTAALANEHVRRAVEWRKANYEPACPNSLHMTLKAGKDPNPYGNDEYWTVESVLLRDTVAPLPEGG